MEIIEREDIISLYDRIKQEYKNLEVLRKDKKNNYIEGLYVFDENQSVKWNKQKCEENNIALATKVEEKEKEIRTLNLKLEEDIREYYGLSEDEYYAIRNFAYDWREDVYNMEDGIVGYLCFFDDVISLIEKVKITKEEK